MGLVVQDWVDNHICEVKVQVGDSVDHHLSGVLV